MLGKKPADKACDTIDTLIGQKTDFKGDITFSGGLRVDGKIHGNVTAKGETNSSLIISEQGEIHGNVTVPHVVLNGVINGNVNSSGRVELQGKARITGDVHYRAIQMELGAIINGNLVCEMAKGEGEMFKSGTSMGSKEGLSKMPTKTIR